jgi:hypothetical protein
LAYLNPTVQRTYAENHLNTVGFVVPACAPPDRGGRMAKPQGG